MPGALTRKVRSSRFCSSAAAFADLARVSRRRQYVYIYHQYYPEVKRPRPIPGTRYALYRWYRCTGGFVVFSAFSASRLEALRFASLEFKFLQPLLPPLDETFGPKLSLSPLCGVLCDCAACVRPASSASFLPWYALYFQVAFENFPICGKSFSTFYRYRFLSGEQAVACLASFSCAVFWPAVRDEARYLWSIFSKQKLLRNRLVFGGIFLPHFTT